MSARLRDRAPAIRGDRAPYNTGMSSPVRTDVIIAGAGIIGMSLALELAQRGTQVVVLERGQVMREASWAAAGMLAADDPENPEALRALSEHSRALYSQFVARIEALSSLRVPFRTAETRQSVGGRRMILDEQSLDPRDLCRALPRACAAAGVCIEEYAPAVRIEAYRQGVQVTTSREHYAAQQFVDCRGAWAGEPLFGEAVPASPRKGQLLAVTLPGNVELLETLRDEEIYIVPRGDGRVIVGATVEDAGFDKHVDAARIEGLFRRGVALWPPLAQGRITDAWAGLRPATPDLLPVLDALAPRVFVATGHYRNGILLAPGTARLMADLLAGREPELDLGPYRADRFPVQQRGDDKRLTAAL